MHTCIQRTEKKKLAKQTLCRPLCKRLGPASNSLPASPEVLGAWDHRLFARASRLMVEKVLANKQRCAATGFVDPRACVWGARVEEEKK